MLVGENTGKFGKLMESFLPQIYGIFNICILFGDHLPKFSPQTIQTAEFANVFSCQCILLYST